MSTAFLPASPTEGQIVTSTGGRKLQYLNGLWRGIPFSTANAPSGGGVTIGEVNNLITTAISNKVTASQVDTQISTAIEALNLGTIATSDLFVSTVAPDNAIGKDGDIWLQTA